MNQDNQTTFNFNTEQKIRLNISTYLEPGAYLQYVVGDNMNKIVHIKDIRYEHDMVELSTGDIVSIGSIARADVQEESLRSGKYVLVEIMSRNHAWGFKVGEKPEMKTEYIPEFIESKDRDGNEVLVPNPNYVRSRNVQPKIVVLRQPNITEDTKQEFCDGLDYEKEQMEIRTHIPSNRITQTNQAAKTEDDTFTNNTVETEPTPVVQHTKNDTRTSEAYNVVRSILKNVKSEPCSVDMTLTINLPNPEILELLLNSLDMDKNELYTEVSNYLSERVDMKTIREHVEKTIKELYNKNTSI